jgi:hypothetical protein
MANPLDNPLANPLDNPLANPLDNPIDNPLDLGSVLLNEYQGHNFTVIFEEYAWNVRKETLTSQSDYFARLEEEHPDMTKADISNYRLKIEAITKIMDLLHGNDYLEYNAKEFSELKEVIYLLEITRIAAFFDDVIDELEHSAFKIKFINRFEMELLKVKIGKDITKELSDGNPLQRLYEDYNSLSKDELLWLIQSMHKGLVNNPKPKPRVYTVGDPQPQYFDDPSEYDFLNEPESPIRYGNHNYFDINDYMNRREEEEEFSEIPDVYENTPIESYTDSPIDTEEFYKVDFVKPAETIIKYDEDNFLTISDIENVEEEEVEEKQAE